MKQNNHPNQQPNTPHIFSIRQRLNSINSPFISPLRIVQSPILHNNDTLFDFQLKNENFQLEPSNAIQDAEEEEQVSQGQSEGEKEQKIDISSIEIDQNNILDVILQNVNLRDAELNLITNQLNEKGNPFLAQLFQYLLKKFKKLKKTKEQMIKYSVRKAFRFISDQLKKQMPNYAVDSNQYLQFYFNKYQQDQSITVPFKKESLEKTMNSAFLKKIFTVDRFIYDYRMFLKIFKKQYLKDNQKKVDSMKDVLKMCIKNKCFKGLDNFKRLPWTSEILSKLDHFSKGLLQYVPPKHSEFKLESQPNEDFLEDCNERWHEKPKTQEENNLKEQFIKHKTKSVILLTPPIQPMNSPNFHDL